ncbi:MAG: imidazole glycerol phosphate synthase subunit HisF [Flavobacteriales bacterium]|nr:imidazole glycerol phosphate synthase subunit HisF [Flavobacteriales bacterium]
MAEPVARPRIIPVMGVEGDESRLVKTVKFKKPNYLGDPINAIRIFNEKMVDELLVVDICASRENREPNYDLIYQMASECFSPLGYGGGVTSFEHARKIFGLGVENIVLNPAVESKPQLVTQLAEAFGSQSIVVSVDAKKKLLGGQRVAFKSGTKISGISVVDFACEMERLGAGELIVQDVDRDGTFEGLNRTLLAEVAKAVNIPVVGCGGASSVEDMVETITETGISAAAAGSIFSYRQRDTRSILINYPTEF